VNKELEGEGGGAEGSKCLVPLRPLQRCLTLLIGVREKVQYNATIKGRSGVPNTQLAGHMRPTNIRQYEDFKLNI